MNFLPPTAFAALCALGLSLASSPSSSHAATLSGSPTGVPVGTNIDLTVGGTLDWAHCGLDSATSFDHKSGVTPQISAVTIVGTDPAQRDTALPHGYSWNDGTPTAGVTNTTTGLLVTGLTNGFQIMVPAETIQKRLTVYVGLQLAVGAFRASLSDGSAADYFDTSLASNSGTTNAAYILDFAAASTDQVFTVRFTADSLFDAVNGFVSLQAATLTLTPSNLPPTVSITNPPDQSFVTVPTNVTISASANDTDGTVSKVEFFVNTNKIGEVASIPYDFVWAATTPGTFVLTAVATDNAGATNVSVPVTVFASTNVPPTVSITVPANESQFQLPTNVTLSALASDTNGTITKVEFFVGSTKIGQATNSPFDVTWTPTNVGIFSLTAVATDNGGATNRSSPVTVYLTTNGGALAASVRAPVGAVDLTAEGTNDWVHWGLLTETSLDRKAGVTPVIANYTLVGTGPAYPFADNFNGYTWTDGTPTPAASNTTTGIYVVGLNNGFQLILPADTTPRTLKLHVGTYGASGRLLAHLSDFSGPFFIDRSITNFGNGPSGVYTLNYASASAGKTLIVQFTVAEKFTSDGNVTLQAATLSSGNAPPTASITSPADNASYLTPASIPITVSASDTDGSIAKVEFFEGTNKLGETTNSPYMMVWNIATPGLYGLTAKATDEGGATFLSRPVNVFVGIGGGVLSGSVATPPATVDLSVEGRVDWAHRGLLTRTTFSHKNGGVWQSSDFATIGGGTVQRLTTSLTGFTWTNGATPNATADNTKTGVYIAGLTNGFQITVPADTNLKRVKVYAGLYGARGRMQASLSDFSAPPFIDASLNNVYGDSLAAYSIKFAATSPGQSLIIRYTADTIYDQSFGNVTLEAATLTEPTAVPANVTWDAGGVRVSVATETSFDYTVEFTDSLAPASWQPLTNFGGTGNITNVMDADSSALERRFYRIKVQ